MVPYSYNMVDMGGIDLAEANGTVVPGVYEKIVEAMNLCGDLILYNWKFAEINIVPSAYSVLQQAHSILINGLIQVTELDQITVIGLPPPPVPVSPLDATTNGTYEAVAPASGFNPVRVAVPERIPVIEPFEASQNGVYAPPVGVDGFSPVTVNVSTGGEGIIFPSSVVSLEYIGALTTFTFTSEDYYAVLGAVDGSNSASISFSVTGATVIESDNKTSVNSSWGSAVTGVLLSANEGDSITIRGTTVARQVMIIIRVSGASVLSSLDLSVDKDRPLSKTVQNTSGGYTFFMAGSTGANGVSVNITSDNELKWSGQSDNPVNTHKYGAFEGDSAINCNVQGTSFATNYAMFFEAE